MPVTTKNCLFTGQTVRSLENFYDELARQLPLPGYFGRNLDALWDILTIDLEGPIELRWEDTETSRLSMGKDFSRLIGLLREVESERDDFHLHLR